jgi:hypothetical protein
MKKYVNGILVDLTAEEINARESEVSQALVDKQTKKNAETQIANDKTSAQNKLKALGLTDAEIEAL